MNTIKEQSEKDSIDKKEKISTLPHGDRAGATRSVQNAVGSNNDKINETETKTVEEDQLSYENSVLNDFNPKFPKE